MTTQATAATLVNDLEAAIPAAHDRRLAFTLARMLGEGEPVAAGRLAAALGRPEPEVAKELASLPGVYRDDDERVVGSWGLSVVEMPHRLRVEGRELYAWCAWDTLFLPIVLGETAEVESSCPTSGERISLTVSPDGVSDVSPTGTVMTFLLPGDDGFSGDVIRSFCHFVHYVASSDAAGSWTSEHEGTFQLTIEDGFELARFWAARLFGVTAH